MCQHGSEGTVADDSDVWDFSTVLLIDYESTFIVDLKTDILEAKTSGVGAATDSYKYDICVKLRTVSILSS